jgi:hypothetical protein
VAAVATAAAAAAAAAAAWALAGAVAALASVAAAAQQSWQWQRSGGRAYGKFVLYSFLFCIQNLHVLPKKWAIREIRQRDR